MEHHDMETLAQVARRDIRMTREESRRMKRELFARIRANRPVGSPYHSVPSFVQLFSSFAKRAVVFVLIISLSLSLSKPVAAKSLPGELLYPIKILHEEIEVMKIRDPKEKASYQVKRTKERIQEMVTLKKENKLDKEKEEEIAKHIEKHVQEATELIQQVKEEKADEALEVNVELSTALQEGAQLIAEDLSTDEELDGGEPEENLDGEENAQVSEEEVNEEIGSQDQGGNEGEKIDDGEEDGSEGESESVGEGGETLEGEEGTADSLEELEETVEESSREEEVSESLEEEISQGNEELPAEVVEEHPLLAVLQREVAHTERVKEEVKEKVVEQYNLPQEGGKENESTSTSHTSSDELGGESEGTSNPVAPVEATESESVEEDLDTPIAGEDDSSLNTLENNLQEPDENSLGESIPENQGRVEEEGNSAEASDTVLVESKGEEEEIINDGGNATQQIKEENKNDVQTFIQSEEASLNSGNEVKQSVPIEEGESTQSVEPQNGEIFVQDPERVEKLQEAQEKIQALKEKLTLVRTERGIPEDPLFTKLIQLKEGEGKYGEVIILLQEMIHQLSTPVPLIPTP